MTKFIKGVGKVILEGLFVSSLVLLPLTLYFAVRDIYITAIVVSLFAIGGSFFWVYFSKTINRRTFVEPPVAVALILMIATVIFIFETLINGVVVFIYKGKVDVLADPVLGILIWWTLISAMATTVPVYIVFFTHWHRPDHGPKNGGPRRQIPNYLS